MAYYYNLCDMAHLNRAHSDRMTAKEDVKRNLARTQYIVKTRTPLPFASRVLTADEASRLTHGPSWDKDI